MRILLIGFVINYFPDVAKPDLINAVNDCCCNARRKKKQIEQKHTIVH